MKKFRRFELKSIWADCRAYGYYEKFFTGDVKDGEVVQVIEQAALDEALELIDLAEVRLASGLDYMKQGKRQFAPNTTNSDVDVWIGDVSKALAKIKAFKESVGE